MNRISAIRVLLITVAVVIVDGWIALAGDITPPAGPVAGTMKTLVDVEPRIAINAANTPGDADSLFKITQPGSYYLTGNMTGVVGKHGMEIVASGVTLDLNGFDLLGVAGSLDGVSATVSDLASIAVVNGSIRGWGGEGVDLGALAANNCRVAQLLASGNTGSGIWVGPGSAVSNCSAYLNSANGIFANVGSAISNSSAYSNTANGINTSSGCTITHCSSHLNTASGISSASGSTVSNCSAYSNSANGISVNSGSTVANCTIRGNSLDGIACASHCVIRGNTCSTNGSVGDGAGIHVTASDNRIEGNNCTFADRGIDVDVAGNFISRNSCSGNTNNWDVIAGNIILVVNATAAGAVTGNSGGVGPGSTDPNANFTY